MRFALGLAYILLLLIVGLWLVGTHFMAATVPVYTGTSKVRSLSGNVTIDRDEYAVPHIHASTEHDAYVGLGYATAQDRLFQMEFFRRIGEGRMSELFGHKTLTIDAWSRTIGFWRIANELWIKASPATRAILTAYTDGINGYIDSRPSSFGFGFDALKLQPQHWRPQECFLMARLMSWEMNFSYFTDAAFSDIALSLDSAHLRSLFPNYPDDGATTIDGIAPRPVLPFSSLPLARKDTSHLHAAPAPQPKPQRSIGQRQMPADVMAILQSVSYELLQFGGIPAPGGGSNSFVVGPGKSLSKSAILENDTHLDLHSPASWYLAHISSDDGLNVAGFSVPGLPIFISGRNESVAWGVTNAMADESDFFIERHDSTHTPKFTFIRDSILVKDSLNYNGPSWVPLLIRMTVHGPVVTDLAPFRVAGEFQSSLAIRDRDTSVFSSDRVVSLMWNGEYALGDEAGGYIQLAGAKNVQQARSLLKDYATPCLNMCLADRTGTIAYQYAGRMPRRNGSEERVLLTRDGANPNDQWTGFISLPGLPSIVNPPRGYLVSANNPPLRSRPIPFSNNWEPSSRADRLSTLLDTARFIDTNWVRNVTTDVLSPYATQRVMPYLLALYPEASYKAASADSTSIYQLDSMRIYWSEDSLRRHTQVTDSVLRSVLLADSLRIQRMHPERDTVHLRPTDPFTAQVLTYLRNWDGGMRTEEIAPTIYSVFLTQLVRNTYFDELGPAHYSEFVFLNNVPLRALLRILPDSNNLWWDDTRTHGVEHRDSIIMKSFRESLRILARTFGRDMRLWQWGRLHTLTFDHVFASQGPLLAHLVNVDAGAMPGDPTTVLQGGYSFASPFSMHVGPSMRMIADMQSNELLAILPTGNSEAMFGDHYKDMLDLYKSGRLLHVPLSGSSTAWKRFELVPQ
jgi:penicillin amidase